MARSADVVKKIMRLKLQLSDTAEPATVLKILQKLKKLDITIDILSETGIGKTVNSLRRHKQAGEIAKSLVYGWKRLVPKESLSPVVDGCLTESVPMKDKHCDQSFSEEECVAQDEVNDSLTMRSKNQDSSEDESKCQSNNWKTGKEDKEEIKWKRKKKQKKTPEVLQENLEVVSKKIENFEDKCDSFVVSKRKKNFQKHEEQETLLGNSEDTHQQSKSNSRERKKGPSESRQCRTERESKTSQSHQVSPQKKNKESYSYEISDNHLKKGTKHSESHNQKRRKLHDAPISLSYEESDNKKNTKHSKAKRKHVSNSNPEKAAMSFESYLNYDETVLKMRERNGAKRSSKKIKSLVKKQQTKECKKKTVKCTTSSPKQNREEAMMNLMDIPLPATLPECDDVSSVDYFESKAEKISSDVCDTLEESALFTGQRLNKKMQVYSGAKSASLPSMMSLYNQCIRTLQNNINLLYETGGVPFEILEPVLERCTPEQLLRIEEFNPMYIGLTDHLWGKHCQRDFKNFKLKEYESWKEMYIRLYEERERKLQRLTKSIVSAHSNKPKGRQVKMAFIHTVAKPPRDVRIQQEIHGTAAAPQPQPPRCSNKFQENLLRPTSQHVETNKLSSSSTGNPQDPRKKTRVAPMMAKSLKAFKKQLQRR